MRILNKCDKNNMEWTVRKLVENYETGLISFNNAVQRGYVWKRDRRSAFIMSVILEKPIPPIYVIRYEDGNYSAIDGKQRSTTLIKFLADEFALEGLDPLAVEDEGEYKEINLNGCTFSTLMPEIQNAIKDAALSFVVLNQPTDEQVYDYFYLLNNGMPLNAMTKIRVKAKSRETITELGRHELFKNILNEKAFEKYENEDIVVKTWAILNQDAPSLETKDIRQLISELDITDENKIQISKCFDRIFDTYKIIEDKKARRKLIKKTHLLSIMRVVWESIEKGQSVEEFAGWFTVFFSGKKYPTISIDYNSCSGAGTNRKESVCTRLSEVQKNYDTYFSQQAALEEN